MSIMCFESRLYRSVTAILGSIHSKGRKGKMFTQFLTEFLAQVCHVRKRVGMLLPEPFPNLLCPEFFLTNGFKIILKLQQGQLPDIFTRFLPYRCGFSHRAKIRRGREAE